MRRWAGTRDRSVVWSIVALVIALFLLFPVYWMFQTAVSPTNEVLSRQPSLLPTNPSFDAFGALLSQPATVAWFRNSGVVTFSSAVATTAVATLAGYALSRFRFRGRHSTVFAMFFGRVLPGTLLALPFFVMFRLLGLLGTLPAVVLANTAVIVPFATLLMKSYFDSIPSDIDEAARVDGCTRMQALRKIMLPLARTGIAANVAFAATASWVDLLFARTLLLDREAWTVPVGVASMIGEVTINWNELMAAGALSVIPVLVLYWFIQPFLVEGFTAGALKG